MGVTTKLKASFCVSSDSEVGLGVCIADYFSTKGVECEFYVVQYKKEHILSPYHLKKLSGYTTTKTTVSHLFTRTGVDLKEFDSDFIFFLLSGPEIFDCIRRFRDTYNLLLNAGTVKKRPITVAGIPGLEIADAAGPYLYRSITDVYFLNSTRSLSLYRKCVLRANKAFHVDTSNTHVTGLPIWDEQARAKPFVPSGQIKNILFAGQNAFPDNLFDRTYLIRKFVEYCEANPTIKLFYKPRNPLGVKNAHPVLWHEEKIITGLNKKKSFPKNFILTYKPISSLLDNTDLCLSISSTVIAEALLRNIPVGIIKDPRLKQSKYGYWYFEGSGIFTNFKKLRENKLPVLNQEWRQENIKADGKNCEDLYNGCIQVLNSQHDSGKMLPFRMHDFYQAHSYMEGLRKKRKKESSKRLTTLN